MEWVAVVLLSGGAQPPFRRRRSMEMQLPMQVAAVSSSRVAQWPSHRAPSVGTQLHIRAAVSMSLLVQSRSRVPRSMEMELPLAVVSSSREAQ